MVSPSELTARAQIRDSALDLYAQRGVDAVSIRDIAAHAGVSPALVIHHYGSKQGLTDAVNARVVSIFDDLMDGLGDDIGALANADAHGVAGFADLLLRGLPPGSPIPQYLRRLLLSDDPAGHELFARWFALSRRLLDAMTAAGITTPTADPDVRAAFLMVNDLAMILFSTHLAEVLGTDPLTPTGARRWAADVLSAYSTGVFHEERP